MASAKKDLKKILREAERQGWQVRQTKNGHWQAFSPDGAGIVTTGGTPSDHKALKNFVAQLRRYGFKWKGH
jgi:predicted RNA binding protein YcfA (HicA-like mRNA interferase family)